jgi:PhnB protein
MVDQSSVPEHARKRADPPSFRARNLSASLTVNDLQRSLAWYRDIVGFAVDLMHERDGRLNSVTLKAGDVRLRLSQDDGAKGANRVKGLGMSLHFATVQNLDEMARRIKERGGTLDSEPADMPWGTRQFRLRDPDGFQLAISSIPANG